METEELIKLVDGIYKNILDKFNPGARQMINAGKAYLKALHGAAAASRLYVDAISKLARQAQQGTWGGSSDIGAALMKIVEVYKEIQDQQMNILKAFYVDLLVPLETNLEKDTKVVQSEQKRFLQQHKQRAETYSKAAAMMKKQRKKSRSGSKTGLAMDKELKNMQVLEEEKTKLDAFCEQSLKNAMTQERRRYGFVLERQCSLAKHHLSYHTQGVNAYQQNIEKWSEVAKTREFLPDSVENIFVNRLRNMSVWQDEDVYSNPRSPNSEEDRISITSQLRKTKSMDASCLDIRSIGDVGSPKTTISRAKSEYNLNSSTHSLVQDEHHQSRRPKSMAVPPPPQWDTQLARALYAYLSSGENQLSFLEGDLIALIGERNKGWQFGENLRTQCSGWFPLAYTEMLDDTNISPSHRNDSGNNQIKGGNQNNNHSMFEDGSEQPPGNSNSIETPASRKFGDIVNLHRSSNNAKQQIRRAIASNNIPPPQLPAPVPTPSLPYQKTGLSQSQSTTNFTTASSTLQHTQHGIKTSSSNFNFQTAPSITGAYSTHPQPSKSDRPTAGANLPLHLQNKGAGKMGGPVGNVSLHSSNDSGFSNDPPPQPEIDYSDDDSIPGQTKLTNSMSKRSKERRKDSNNNSLMRSSTVRHSQSHGALASGKQQFNMASDVETLSKEHKHLIKRTKSFWKFGKNNSDSEILEGMALWRHRDLVDVEKEPEGRTSKKQRKRDVSNDSESTINNNNNTKTLEKPKIKYQVSKPEKNTNRVKKEQHEENTNEYYNETKRKNNNMENHFYDDEDGLMMKTVNRKNILKRYSNEDSSEIDSDESDETTTDDPYDIIKHEKTMNNTNGNFPNVAEIGKKLEKLSKSNKYVTEKNKLNNNMNDEHFTKQQNSEQQTNRKENSDKMHRRSYATIDSDLTENDKRYYESYDESDIDRRYLPKLSKPNGKYEDEDLMGYGESLQRRMKNTQYSDRTARNGNMYGPWYDLWGLDATTEKKRHLN